MWRRKIDRTKSFADRNRAFKNLKYEAIRRWWWDGQWEWKMMGYAAAPKFSGRLKTVERIEGSDPPRVLCLCACGRTKVVLLKDIVQKNALRCSWNCVRDKHIRWPHWKTQEMYRIGRTGNKKIIRRGPPKWDPVLRKSYFAEETTKGD